MESNTSPQKWIDRGFTAEFLQIWGGVAGVLLLKAIWIGWVARGALIGLGPDEAQYWMWSTLPDWGYYSKPPGIAWSIAAGTSLLGSSALGVRLSALLVGTLLPLVTAKLALCCGLPRRTAAFAALLMAVTPLGTLATLFATTDGPMTLFLTLALCCVAEAFARSRPIDFIRIGLLIACGALFKWPIYALWIPLLLLIAFRPELRSRHFLSGVLISATALIPPLWWNANHHWSTLQHVGTAMISHGDGGPSAWGNPLDFLGAQIALISPLPLLAGICALIGLWRTREEPALRLVATMAGGGIALLIAASLFKKIQSNWGGFLYPPLLVAASWQLSRVNWRRYASAAWLSSFGFSAIAIALPYLCALDLPIPGRWNPYRHNIGWQNLDQQLHEAGYRPDSHFLFADKYQTAAVMSFYSPGQRRSYLLNFSGGRHTQFDFWPSMAVERMGATGYYIWVENRHCSPAALEARKNHLAQLLAPYFLEVHWRSTSPLWIQGGEIIKAAILFECRDYNGLLPPPTASW